MSGNDFLPLVIKLDDLLTHLQSVGELVARLSRLQGATPEAELEHATTDVIAEGAATIDKALEPSNGAPEPSGKPMVSPHVGLLGMLEQLATRIAKDNGKEVVLSCAGFEAVPQEYRRIVKDVAIQAIRNAVVHGIETPDVRRAAGKSAAGQVRLSFQARDEGGYKMSVEDDGQGLATERIKEVALQKGLVTAEQADNLDPKKVYSLLFTPGFSTLEHTTKDAGRGVGMNLVADLMYQIGGKVGVASARGRFTRLTVSLPAQSKTAGDTVAA